jgi:hypothetical protein
MSLRMMTASLKRASGRLVGKVAPLVQRLSWGRENVGKKALKLTSSAPARVAFATLQRASRSAGRDSLWLSVPAGFRASSVVNLRPRRA